MTIEFVFTGINNISKLYQSIRTEYVYIGDAYLRSRMDGVKHALPDIQQLSYEQSFGRFANEVFVIIAHDHYYELIFTIDTYKKSKARMTVNIRTESEKPVQCEDTYVFGDGTGYDRFLEQLKLAVKDSMKRDWAVCSWIMDEQTEQLCSHLYTEIFKAENRIRAFVNKILIRNLGQDWIRLPGLEKYEKSRQKRSADFKREVPCFSDIDDTLLSMTIESLRKIITEGKVYDREIDWKDMDMTILHQKLALGSSDSVMEMIKSGRKIKVDIWRDFFKQYFTDSDYAKKEIEDFIKNRNHVAHNKLLNWDGYQRMKRNIRELDEVIQKANDSFENSFMSEEEFITWSIGTGNEPKEVYTVGELDYLPIRIYGETGVKIRDNEEIYRLFAESIDKLYNEIADAFYFNTMVEVTGKHEIGLTEDEKKVFSVKDLFTENIILDILADMSFDCAMDGESLLQLFCRCSGGELFHAVLRYHNGSGAEDSGAGKILLSSESVYDTEQLEGFMEEMKRYLEQYLKQQYIEGKSFKE